MVDDPTFSVGPMTRRRFLARSGGALAAALPLVDMRAQTTAGNVSYVDAETMYGRVRGASSTGLVTFKGIPYAGSVAGKNRFKAAPAPQPWTGVRDALALGAPALQPGGNRPNESAAAEDCLFLNIWTPALDGRKRPVMLYNHGGGFTTGSGGAGYQDGGNLARTWDVVVVATNHRLGLPGYLYLGHLGGDDYATSGNQGLLDIRDGMQWVKNNIERFGGDPNNVMIFGESGGGAKTSCLYAMPSAAPYFHKASIESGPGIRIYPLDSAIETTAMVLKQLGLERSQWRQLLDVPAQTLMEVQIALAKNPSGPLLPTGGRKGISGNPAAGGFGPIVDGRIMPNHPFDPTAPAVSKDKPLMVGYNRDEMNFFFAQGRDTAVYSLTDATLKERLDRELGANATAVLSAYKQSRPNASPADLYVAIASTRFAGTGSIAIAERKHAQRGAPVFMYVFVHESDRLIPGTKHAYGAAHAGEIIYKFNNIPASNATSGSNTFGDSRPSSVQAARAMSEFWSTFARTGQPVAKGQPSWPAYATDTRATMFIDAECRVVNDPFSPERQIWDRVER
jgi:para-nitrobenzyl esterase